MKTHKKPLNRGAGHFLLFFLAMMAFSSHIFAAGGITGVGRWYDAAPYDRIGVWVERQATQDNCAFGNTHALYPNIYLYYRVVDPYAGTSGWQWFGTWNGSTGPETNNAKQTQNFYINNPIPGVTYQFSVRGYTVDVYPCNSSALGGQTGQQVWGSDEGWDYVYQALPTAWQFSNLGVTTNSARTSNTVSWTIPSSAAQTEINQAVDEWKYKLERCERKWGESNWSGWTLLDGAIPGTNAQFTDNNRNGCYEYQYRLELYYKKFGLTYSARKIDSKSLLQPSLVAVTTSNFVITNPAADECNTNARTLQWKVDGLRQCTETWFKLERKKGSLGNFATIADYKTGTTYGGEPTGNGSDQITAVTAGTTTTFSFSDNYQIENLSLYIYKLTAYNRSSVEGQLGPTTLSLVNVVQPQTNVTGSLTAASQTLVANVNNVAKTIQVSWTDVWNNESKFFIYRKLKNTPGDGTKIAEVDSGTISYTDAGAALCQQYVYTVKATNACHTTNPVLVGTSADLQISGSTISDTYNELGLKAYKGFSGEFVQLNWSIANNAASLTQQYIYRRLLGDTATPQKIATLGSGIRQYQDFSGAAGVLYEYFIDAEGPCGVSTMVSNRVSDVGFRIPFGMVIGHVEYEGGISVESCKVRVEKSSGIQNNKSVYLDGDRDYFMLLDGDNSVASTTDLKSKTNYAHQSDLDFMFNTTKGRTIEFWFNATEFKKAVVYALGKAYDATSSSYYLTTPSSGNKNWELVIKGQQSISFTINVNPGEWHHFAITEKAGNIKIYIDGSNLDMYDNPMSWQRNASWITTANPYKYALFVGSDRWDSSQVSTFKGYIDEFRCWGVARTEKEINATFSSFLQGNETDLGVYLRMDEGVGNFLYDASFKSGAIYNGNHAVMARKLHSYNQIGYSTTTAPADKLGTIASTDASGNYLVNYVTYDNSGDLFKVTPYIPSHQFQPGNRTLFLGSSNPVHNNQDFKDISSFLVEGTIYYGNSETEHYCPAKGIYLTVDGNVVMKDGLPAQTNANGEYAIRVPIGPHYIGTMQAQHTFASGRFPATGTFDFQEPKPGLDFVDNTRIKIIGKVVGGLEQGNKPSGLQRAKNNIGTAKLVFESTMGCYSDTVVTDQYGEYSLEVFPLEYTLHGTNSLNPALFIASNPLITFPVQNIDLSLVPNVKTIRDTVFDNSKRVIGIDSVQAHLVKDFVYRAGHSLLVQDTMGNPFTKGETYFVVGEGSNADTILTNQLAYPVFTKGNVYVARVKLTEIYANKDTIGKIIYDTTQASDGTITINNQLTGGDPYSFESGDTVIAFQAGDPNITQGADASKDFTKRIQITSAIGITQNQWTLDGYVFGSKADGTKFATQSPQVVDHILRDPPGSQSSAKIVKETEFASSQSWSLEGGAKQALETKIGMKFSTFVGLGVMVKNEVEGTVTANTEFEFKVGGGESFEEKVTFSEDISTSDDAAFVGADADLFIGKSMNMDFGVADHLVFMDTSLCGAGTPCKATDKVVSTKGKKYSIGRRKGFQIDPTGYNTYFVYTQRHIKKQLIPDLILLRNQILETSPYYTRVFTDKNDLDKYGSNNDDPIWAAGVSSLTPLQREGRDSAGLSYIFTKVFASTELQIDSVRWCNEQIRLWKEALSRNEMAKLNALTAVNVNNPGTHIFVDSSAAKYGGVLLEQQVSTLEKNISFSAGQSYTRSTKLSNQIESKVTWEINLSGSIGADIDAELPGFITEASFSYTVGLSTAGESSRRKATSVEYAFTLKDDDVGDFYSVDVLDGGRQNGPIFKTRGAETACPYEPALVTEYYKKGTVIQPSTVAREKPGISIFPAKQVGVPSDQVAVFTLTLTNENTDDDMTYELSVDDASNANGANIQVDGSSVNRDFYCPAGSSITKTLTVRKSPYATDFNDIILYFSSKCDVPWAQLQVAQTKFSVSFVPTCSQVVLQSPTNQWVLNSNFNSKLPIIMKDYDLNFAGFEKAIFRYKPSSSATWIEAKTFYNLPSAGGDTLLLSRNDVYTAFDWDVTNLPDGSYDIQIQTVCNSVLRNSDIYSGKIDRLLPVNFGQPTPLNGVLTPNDELSIKFNETINQGIINKNLDIDVRGVLNATEIRHNTSLLLNGAQTKMIVPAVSLDNKSFTLEFHAKRLSNTAQILASQAGLWNVGFNANRQLYFEIGTERITTTVAADTNWHHYAIVFDNTLHKAYLYIDAQENVNKTFAAVIDVGATDMVFGGQFSGAIHEVRLWNDVRASFEILLNYLVSVSPSSAGLMGYWPLDEGRGTLAADATGKRVATVPNSWLFAQSPRAIALNNTGYLEIESAALNADEYTDFTLAFWFKPSGWSDGSTLFSNGNVDSGSIGYNKNSWRIYSNALGKLFVKNNNHVLAVNNPTFNNNEWYHFALVVDREGTSDVFINGEKTVSVTSLGFMGLGSAKTFFGMYGKSDTGGVFTMLNKFSGSVDELTFWNTAREQKQIARDAYYRLAGNEPGLLMYYPFEQYSNIGFGLIGVTETTLDLADKTAIGIQPFQMTLKGNIGSLPTFTNQTAPIKMERPVEDVTFNYVINNDAIIITPTTVSNRIEKTILDITVRNLQDMNGNKMSSAVTWTAYVNKNQVVWTTNNHQATIKKGATYTFTATIENKGGKQENYTITNLPLWLDASQTSGILSPLGTQQIVFTVKEGLNIGTYDENIALSNQFGSGEILALTLSVTGDKPNWTLNPADFESSMGIVGQLEISGVLSTDETDMVAAFIGGELRGVANVNKGSNYRVYLNVYSNTSNNQPISFRLYDASSGLVLENILPSTISFTENALIGTQATPVLFKGGTVQLTTIDLKQGWNWVSLNVNPLRTNVDSVLDWLDVTEGDIIKGQAGHDEYSNGDWNGGISVNGGINFKESYRLKVAHAGTLQVKGSVINLKTTPVTIDSGWNWISYLGSNLLRVNEALASLNANTGDVVKGQKAFAVYDAVSGWSGSLTMFEPGHGYMLSATHSGAIVYPKNPSFASFGKTGDAPVVLETDNSMENNMNVVAELVTDNYVLTYDYYLIAKDGNGKLIGGVSNQSQLFYLTVQGNVENAQVRFFLKHKLTGDEIMLQESIGFRSNQVVGYPQSLKLHLDKNASTGLYEKHMPTQHLSVYPNPLGGENILNIMYANNEDARVTIEVYSVLGVKVGEVYSGDLGKGEQTFRFNTSKLSPGVYMMVVDKEGASEVIKFNK